MGTPRPSLFIGSSKEGLDVARAIELNLQHDAEATLWNGGVFGLNTGTLEALVNALDRFDFAILVITPDDVVTSRDVTSQAPRDNVMFELGLFMGRLGRARTFAVCSNSQDMKLPADLAGVTLPHFDAGRTDGNLIAAVSPACTMIRQSIRDLGVSETKGLARLSTATTQMEGMSEQVTQVINLLARSRVLELEVISKQFDKVLPSDFLNKVRSDLRDLEAAAAPRTTVVIDVREQGGLPVANADVLLVAGNGTHLRGRTDPDGKALFTIAKRRLLAVFCAHPSRPAFLQTEFDPVGDLKFTLRPDEGVGSLISLRGWETIPGLSGTINPIHDSANRLYVYTKNIAVDGGKPQPVPFQIGQPLHCEDAEGRERLVTFVAVIADCFLIEHKSANKTAP
ncbi:MAG: nucleotide-binding protein [Verrucomicrobiales bacterium]|nr:nucleotide-binding protein [Verrucomicrobiales bacterium]